MSVKGGYQILNLQNKDLQYSPTIPGAYEVVEGNYLKPIMISGIVIGGVEKPAVYRQPVVSGSSYVFENVYGYDVTLTDSDTLSLASTQFATRAYVDQKALLSNIVDSDGNNRFKVWDLVDGSTFSGTLTLNYKKMSISGHHLSIVICGTFTGATSMGGDIATFNLKDVDGSSWLKDKLVGIFTVSEPNTVIVSYGAGQIRQSGLSASSAPTEFSPVINKAGDGFGLFFGITSGQVTSLDADETYEFRMEYNLIIE